MPNCPAYPKIETLFERDDKFHVDTNRLRRPEFGLIKHWLVTEKIDGTNIRVGLQPPSVADMEAGCRPDDYRLRFYGRTNKAQVPTFLLAHLQDTFTLGKMQALWRGEGTYPITLYGEGYGARIQKGGGNYREGVSFRLFDVLIDNRWWLDWENVCDVAEKLGLKAVPLIKGGVGVRWITAVVENGLVASRVAREDRELSVSPIAAEGIVARTDPYLFDKHGCPLRFKLKTKDFGGNDG